MSCYNSLKTDGHGPKSEMGVSLVPTEFSLVSL